MDNMVIKECAPIQMDEIIALYNSVGWTNYTSNPAMLEGALRHSLKVLSVYDGTKLVGLLRMVGDGYSIIYIQDILVLPEYQGCGIGKSLLQQVDMLFPKVYQKVLLTDNQPQNIRFYESCGFSQTIHQNTIAFWKFTPKSDRA